MTAVLVKRQPGRLIRTGCATNWSQCPHGESAVTVQLLDKRGNDRGGGTTCHHSGDIEVQDS